MGVRDIRRGKYIGMGIMSAVPIPKEELSFQFPGTRAQLSAPSPSCRKVTLEGQSTPLAPTNLNHSG